MNYFSICAVVKNEQRYLSEWIKYHRIVGCERFYLYLNEGLEFEHYNVPTRYEKDIDLIRWPGMIQQPASYQHCLERFRDESRWIAFIDVDEFLVPHNFSDMPALLKNYEAFAAVAFHWYLFGSNGHQKYQPIPVVERFTRRQNRVNPHLKCIVNPKRTLRYHTPHSFITAGGTVDESGYNIGNNPLHNAGTCNVCQINHYVTKSIEECYERRSRPRADNGENRPDIEAFLRDHDFNEVADLTALNIWRRGLE